MLPEPLRSIYAAQPQELKDALKRRLETKGSDPVLLCCKTDSEGNEVCIAVEKASECAAGNSLKSCTYGQSNPDGSVTCYDEAEE